jgi:PIN domain nuclease of toxin-antitoxin system
MTLLDTCALIWLNTDRKAFSPDAGKWLDRHADSLAISPVSLMEIGMKSRKGMLELPCPLARWYEMMTELYSLNEIPVSASIAMAASDLPEIHKDPFDRIIIATAIECKMPVVTADAKFKEYPKLKVIW